MATLVEVKAWLETRLPDLLAAYDVPAAVVGVRAGGKTVDVAAGILSRRTGIEATTDSLFQIGSITKPWTATLIMQLVDAGRLDIDSPVREYLPDFGLKDESAAAEITIRQLLCHSAGFEGDVLVDHGPGDDCVEALVATLTDAAQLFPPGELYSYNNAGYSVLGRVVEVLHGESYDQCLREHLISPLGLTHTAASPNEAVLHRAAVGHLKVSDGAPVEPTGVWALPRAYAPAGAMLAMRARDLLAFAELHMSACRGASDSRLLSMSAARDMQRAQLRVPYLGNPWMAMGLGWALFDWPGGLVIGHNGGTIGQTSYLLAVPDRDVAIAVLANAEDTFSIFEEISKRALHDLAGVEMPLFPRPPASPRRFDARRYVGTYASGVEESQVTQDPDGRVWLKSSPTAESLEFGSVPDQIELVLLDGDTLIAAHQATAPYATFAFLGDDGAGHAQYLHSGQVSRYQAEAPRMGSSTSAK